MIFSGLHEATSTRKLRGSFQAYETLGALALSDKLQYKHSDNKDVK